MASIESLRDLLEQLRADPSARDELRVLLYGDLSPRLAEAVEGLADAQRATEQRLGALTERVDTLTQRVDQLAQAQLRTELRLEALTARVDTLTERLGTLTERVDALTEQISRLTDRTAQLATDVDGLLGEAVERRYRERGYAYFQRIASRLHLLTPEELDDVLQQAVADGLLREDEAAQVRLADAVFTGRLRENGVAGYLVVEASRTVDRADVDRAGSRARLLGRTGQPVIAVVAGDAIDNEATGQAVAAGVWRVTDGRAVPPDGAAA